MVNSDGRVALDKGKLKTHRRRLGLSQEQMALQCGEQGLYVSIASLKRAEAERKVLYRTARDISIFFDTPLESLLKEPQALAQAEDGEHANTIDVYRTVILTHIIYDTPLSQLPPVLPAPVVDILNEYAMELQSTDVNGLLLASKTTQTDGNEPLRACYCAKQLLSALPAHIGRRCIAVISGQSTSDFSLNEPTTVTHVKPSIFFSKGGDASVFEPSSYASIFIGDELQAIVGRYIQYQKWKEAPHPELANLSALVFDATAEQQPLALAGRQLELYQFRSLLDSSKNYRAAQVFCLNGVAGIGKTRLLKECTHIAREAGYLGAELTALDVRGIHNNKLITQVARKLLELDIAKPSPGSGDTSCFRQLLSDHENRLLRALENDQLDEDTQLSFGLMAHQEILEQQVLLCVKLTRHICHCTPVLLCIEDLHWADQGALDFLAQWIPLIKDQPIIVLATHRPEEHIIAAMSHLALSAPLTTVNLSPLNPQDAQFLAQQICSRQEYQQLCISKAEGNPLFLEQLLRGEFEHSQQLPYTIQSLITAKLDQLPSADRLAVVAASSVGQKFSLELVRFLTGNEHYQPAELIKSFLISPVANGYCFNHALICDGIYQSIQDEAKSELNRKCALWYSDKDATLELRYLFRIKSPCIAEKLSSTVALLVNNYRFDLAMEFIDCALENNIEGMDLFETLHAKADIHNKLGRFDLTVETANSALEHARSPADEVDALILMANALNTLDKFDKALENLERAEYIANTYSMPTKLSQIYYLKGNFFFPKGDIERCLVNHKKALESAKQARDLEMQARALGGLCDAAYAGGKMYSAYGYVRECLEICDNHDLKAVKASNLFMSGTVRIYQNQSRLGLRDTLNGIELTKLVGHSRAEIVSRLTAAWIYIDQLDTTEARYHIQTAITLAESVGARRFIPFLQESQARIDFLEGNTASANSTINEAIEHVEKLKAQQFIGPWLYATAALVCGNQQLAEQHLAKGQALLYKGCIGHNYFRFYVLAMECCIQFGLWQQVEHYKCELESYTQTEPSPWSQYYIQRAALLIKHHKNAVNSSEVRALILQAQEAGLLSSVAQLEAILTVGIE